MNLNKLLIPSLVFVNACANNTIPVHSGVYENSSYQVIENNPNPIILINYKDRDYLLHDTDADNKIDEIETKLMGFSVKVPITDKRVPLDLREKIDRLYELVLND